MADPRNPTVWAIIRASRKNNFKKTHRWLNETRRRWRYYLWLTLDTKAVC
jgi:hypothetical protein